MPSFERIIRIELLKQALKNVTNVLLIHQFMMKIWWFSIHFIKIVITPDGSEEVNIYFFCFTEVHVSIDLFTDLYDTKVWIIWCASFAKW